MVRMSNFVTTVHVSFSLSLYADQICMDDGSCASRQGECMAIPLPKYVKEYHPEGSDFLAARQNVTGGCSKKRVEGSEIECACVGKNNTVH